MLTSYDLTDELTRRLHSIRRDHKLRTGWTLAIPDALDELERQINSGERDALPDADLMPLRAFLIERNYDDHIIEVAVADVRKHGSAWATDAIDESDKDEAEALVSSNGWPNTLPVLGPVR